MKCHITFCMLVCVIALAAAVKAQTPVTLADSDIKVKALSEDAVFFGFAAGDKIIFSFEDKSKKELKEITIREISAEPFFTELKVFSIKDREINIPHPGIYEIMFKNNGIPARECHYKITRIAASAETQNFNSTVYNKTVYDTTYRMEDERYLVRADTDIVVLTDQTINLQPNGRSSFFVDMPFKALYWSYYICTTPDGRKVYDKAQRETENDYALRTRYPGYSPLGALCLGKKSHLLRLEDGDKIKLNVVKGKKGVDVFMAGSNAPVDGAFFNSYAVNDFSSQSPTVTWLNRVDEGQYLCLLNTSKTRPLNAMLKASALRVTEVYNTRKVRKMYIDSRPVMYLKN